MARKKSIGGLGGLFDAAPTPIYAVDEKRRIVYANAACLHWCEITADALLGQRCDFHSGAEAAAAAAIAAGLCPSPEAFAGRTCQGIVACGDSQTGGKSSSRRLAEFLPLSSDPLISAGVLVMVSTEDLGPNDPREGAAKLSETARLHDLVRDLRRNLAGRYHVQRLAGESPVALRLRAQVKLASQTRSHVVICGPPGSGREHLARTIHYGVPRDPPAPLTPLECRVLDAELMQTALTAFVRNTTVAKEQGAAVLLLEADRMPADAQMELLGMLRLGLHAGGGFELRIIATCREPLVALAKRGKFRADLAELLSPLVIEMVPLAQRREDIPLLAQLLLEEANVAGNKQLAGFAGATFNQLAEYSWPGNLDQLTEVVYHAHHVADGPFVLPQHLPQSLRLAIEVEGEPRKKSRQIVLPEALANYEKELISRAVRHARGNKAKAARQLGISRARLLRRLSQLKLDEQDDAAK